MNTMFKVVRKEVATGRIFENECTKEQVDNITKYPISLYSLESISPVEEIKKDTKKEFETIKEVIKTENAIKINTAKELYKIIRRGKKDIKEYVNCGTDRTLIYNWYELIKKDCTKYSESNKTTKQMYFEFLQWWNKYDKILFPEYH